MKHDCYVTGTCRRGALGARAPALFQNDSKKVPPLGQIEMILWSIKQNAFKF